MFGSTSNNSPFGGGGGFGSSGGGFGSSGTSTGFGGGFGSPAPAPFGGGGGFGASTATPFGSQAPAPTFGSTFGSSNNTFGQSTNTFGQGGAFGGGGGGGFGNSSTPFGSPAPATAGLFGSNPAPAPFGAPAPSGGGLFGAPAPTSTGLFGASPAPAPFGQAASSNTGFGTGFAFGASTTPTPGFGAPAAPFGSPAPAPFGSFGGSPAPTPGLFGGAPTVGVQGGTKHTAYQATNRQDGTSSISMQTITAMQPYEHKSLEELRYEDYMMGNKGSGNAPGATTGGFGGTGFGVAPSSGFGSASTFGKPATGSLFGGNPTPAPATFGFASAPAPSTGLFGSSPAPAPPAFGGFGSSPSSAPPAFGAPAPASTSLFGAAPAPFAAPASSTGFGFGTSTPSTGFGASSPAPSLFGSAPAPFASAPTSSTFSFAAPAPVSNAFGAPASTGSPFGSTLTSFNQPAPAPAFGGFGGFGSTTTSSFPTPAPASTSFFTSPAPAPTSFGSFTQPPAAAPPVFGQSPAAAAPMLFPPAGSIIPQSSSEVLTHQIQALENKRKEMEKLEAWRGSSAEDSSVTPVSQPQFEGSMSTGVGNNSQYSAYRPSPRSTAKIRPRGFGPGVSPSTATSTSSPSLNAIGTGGRPMMSPDAYAASSVKRLVIKPGAVTPKPKMRLRLMNGLPTAETKPTQPTATDMAGAAAATQSPLPSPVATEADQGSSPSPMKSPVPTGTPHTIPIFGRETSPRSQPTTPASVRANFNVASGGKTVASLEKIAPPPDPGYEYYQKVVGSPDGIPPETPSPRSIPQPQSSKKKSPAYLPKLTKPGYVMNPPLAELSLMSEADLASLAGFSVRHDPYGVVEWEGAVDVRNADLDASIVIGQNDVSVYTKDEEEGRKPPVGSKLNRPAVITFFNVFPKAGPDADDDTKMKFANKIVKSTKKMEAEFISYDKDTGEWKIRVLHFSRYGLDDDDSEAEEQVPRGTLESQIEDADLWQDEDLGMDDAAVVSDVEMEKESNDDELVMRDAEAAYASIFDTVRSYSDMPPKDEDMSLETDSDDEEEFDDDESEVEVATVVRAPTSEDDYNWAASLDGNMGISTRIANKVFASDSRQPSNIDFGKRMGRSFRVAWGPDGSFFSIGKSGTTLHKFRPVFDDPEGSDASGVAYLKKHKSSCGKAPTSVDDGSPRFFLPTAIGNEGNSSSHEALCNTISAYAESGDEISKQAFSLLSCFVDNEDSVEMKEGPDSRSSSQFGDRRKEAVVRFLCNACRPAVEADIQEAISCGDAHSAILAALIGCDIAQACELASDMGEEDLAACIGAFDAQGSSDISEQARLEGSSGSNASKLRQIYRLLSGDVEAAGQLDWMRALLVRIVYEEPLNPRRSLSDILQSFGNDLSRFSAPFPTPKYASVNKTEVHCILYRLLRLADEPQNISITEIVDPSGASIYYHDFALAFHLASCLLAAGYSGLSPSEEASLIDGYSAQLCSAGHWEWAVYVCLCSLNHDMIESFSLNWKRNKAKDLVLRNFRLEDIASDAKRQFLEREVGIPKEWMYEALATRQGKMGDPFEYIRNLAAYSPREASAAVEELIVPNLLCMNSQDLDRSLKLLEAFQSELSPLSRSVLNLFDVSREVHNLLSAARDTVESELPGLSEDLREIENQLIARRSECDKLKDGVGLKFCANIASIPLSAMLYESIEQCSILKLQMKAIEMGVPMTSGDMSKRRLTSLLAFDTVDGYDEKWATANVIRALR